MNGLEALKIAKETGRRFKYPEGKNFYSTKELNIEFHRGIEFKTLFAEGWEVEPALIDHISVRVKVYDMGEIVEDATTTPEDAIARIQRYAQRGVEDKPDLIGKLSLTNHPHERFIISSKINELVDRVNELGEKINQKKGWLK